MQWGEERDLGLPSGAATERRPSVGSRGTLEASSVTGLRDRLLREARSERARCLEVAEAAERRRAELRGICHAATQTDPVAFADGPPQTQSPRGALGTTALGSTSALGTGALGASAANWTQRDEAAQAEALRTIQLLGQRGNQSRFSESRVSELEGELRAERAGRQELEAQVGHERSRKEAAQQQVLCLEYELDGKEAALQVAERALEKADLQQTAAGRLGDADLRVEGLRAQLVEKERELELKDQHIHRLLTALRQQRPPELCTDLGGW